MLSRFSLIAAGLLAFTASSFATSLVTNGDFEAGGAPVGNNGDVASQQLFAGSAALSGWAVTGSQIAWIGIGNPYGITASSGDNFVDLTGWAGAGSGISQTLITTIGTRYSVKFDLGNSVNYNFGTADALTVAFGDQSRNATATQSSSPSSWDTFSFDFTADSMATNLSFTGLTEINYVGLDNVVVTALDVPEPANAALMMLGILGIASAAAQRSRKLASYG